MLNILLNTVLVIFLLIIGWLSVVKIVRRFYKFPMPEFMANLIDNPLRRKIQPPYQTAIRHGIEPGMTVLDVGPGNGTYTLAAARRVGDKGKIVAVDIEPRMIERVLRRAEAEKVTNIETRIANVKDLPFEDGLFDVVYMIAVIGEIPGPEEAIQELHRVLKSTGTLVISELFPDPDYSLPNTLVRLVSPIGFRLRKKIGNLFYYTLIFEKASST
ncbi:MAG: class I SAM-dependent methyltransferase [Chloroflexota bacterium]